MGEVVRLPGGTVTLEAAADAFLEQQHHVLPLKASDHMTGMEVVRLSRAPAPSSHAPSSQVNVLRNG